MQHFSQKESPVLFCFFLWQEKNNKSSTSFRANVPKMCRRSSGITADLHLSVGYSVSPLLLVQLFYFYTLQQQNQTEALWSAASRHCSSACVNWSQSLRASVRRLQLVGRLAAMTAAAADDSLSECINNAKSYLHSAKKLKMGLFFSVTVTSQTDVQLLAAQTSSENDPQWKIWFSELRGVCLCVFVCVFFLLQVQIKTNHEHLLQILQKLSEQKCWDFCFLLTHNLTERMWIIQLISVLTIQVSDTLTNAWNRTNLTLKFSFRLTDMCVTYYWLLSFESNL